MNKKLTEALEHCRQIGLHKVVLAVPFPLSPKDVEGLRQNSMCNGVVLARALSKSSKPLPADWVGSFMPGGNWTLPTAKGKLVFVGPHLMLTQQMAMRALRSGRLTILCRIDGQYQALQLYRFLLWPLGEQMYRRVSEMPHDSWLRKTLFGVATSPLVLATWRRIFKREGVSGLPGTTPRSGLQGEALFGELCRQAMAQPANEKIAPIPGRVLLVNAGLAAGGAERQIVNTLIGLRDSGQCENVALLAEYIDHAPHLDFFLHALDRQGIEVSQVQHRVVLAQDGLSSLPPQIAELAADLPPAILEEILNLVEEFRARRPSVVHAWQDASSIKAGIAALIAGVPRIVLGSRNVIPTCFSYYQDHMHPAYRALAALDCVQLLNNSEAGAHDYTRWLGLPRARFAVLRNGVDLRELQRVDATTIAAYRAALGIPVTARVVGSVFRFWSEKRPMLWLEAAALLASRCPDIHFLIVGEGPMRAEMENFVNGCALRERVHMPGARPEVATPLCAMDLFVLTSEFEGTPNVVLEAQWLGLPVVATDAGGTREAFEPGVSGSLATKATPETIASLAFALLSDPAKMEQAQRHGPAFVTRMFGLPRMVHETLALYGLKAD